MSVNTRKISKRILNLSLVVAVSTGLLFALLNGADNGRAQAQTGDTPTPVPEQSDEAQDRAAILEAQLTPPQHPNLDSNLNQIVEQAQSGQFTAQAAAASAPIYDDTSVAVTLYITEGYAGALTAYLESNGASPRNIGADYIEAYVPVSLLPQASEQDGVLSVRTIIPPQPAQGAVVSQGVAAHGAPAWHSTGIRGQGVRIGIIDSGFEGFHDLRGTELPQSVEVRCYADIGVVTSSMADCDNSDAGRHGTAVTETAFDIAPEATYYISNPISYGDIIATVEWMVAHDVDVINYSLSDLWEGPGDGTSPFNNSIFVGVDAAVAGGITWVSAAGNSAMGTWFGAPDLKPIVSSSSTRWQHWNGADYDNCMRLTAGEDFRVQLRWDDSWGGADTDLSMALWNSAFDIVSSSRDPQTGGDSHIPYELIVYTPVTSGIYCLTVTTRNSTVPSWIQMQVLSASSFLLYHTEAGSIESPAESANPGLLAVGAAPWNDTLTIEEFSSQGPTPDGRIKPDIVGADRGRTVSYRSADNPDGAFPGTSQAAPHVAGLAALVKQRFPDYTPQQVTRYLKNNAEARGAVPNNTWGYGFAKLPAIAPEPTVTPTSIPTPGTTPEPTPVTPQVPQEVLNRISMLETLVTTLQSLISTLQNKITTLDSRVAALETTASVPTPIPTATLAPTPTTVPGVPTPVPTPIPTATPVLTATPITDACVTPITGDGVITASWISTCQSTNRPLDPAADGSTYYARYYTFDLSAPSSVSITLESSEDTFLYLLNDKGKTGSVAHFNDDIDYPNNPNSRIEQPLEAGSYTIEAATYDSGVVGSSFTLTLIGIE